MYWLCSNSWGDRGELFRRFYFSTIFPQSRGEKIALKDSSSWARPAETLDQPTPSLRVSYNEKYYNENPRSSFGATLFKPVHGTCSCNLLPKIFCFLPTDDKIPKVHSCHLNCCNCCLSLFRCWSIHNSATCMSNISHHTCASCEL